VTYCIAYILSCITKHSSQYKILMLGRVLGGIATSLLFSAFESWLVAEHNKVSDCCFNLHHSSYC
jgi:predicted MFS family arabinose efflux permease